MAYVVCPSCHQNALPVATRCPRCGLAFEGQRFPSSGKTPRRSWPALGLLSAGVVVSVLAANTLMRRLDQAPSPAPPAKAIVPAARVELPPRPPALSSVATAPIADTVVIPISAAVTEPQPTPPPVTAEPAVPGVAPADPSVAQRLYASTWTNVRAARSNAAQVLRILRPGEGVQVDLLEQGWYRIRTAAQPLGYVDRRLLDPSPTLATP